MKRVLTTGLLLLIAFIAGFAAAKIEQPKEIITSQMAADGEVQITYSDGTSETFYMDSIAQDDVRVERVLTESTDTFYLDSGDYGIEFSNGSWGIVNEYTNTYIFQPAELGDWDYQVNTLEQFENIVRTYLYQKNN